MAAMIECANDATAFDLTRALREQGQRAWAGNGPLDVAAIEYRDAASLAFVPDDDYARDNVTRPRSNAVLLLVQIEVAGDGDAALEGLAATLTECGVTADPVIAMPGDDAGATRLFELREAVPAAVNAAVAGAKQRDEQIQKTAGDFIVPFDRLAHSVALYRRAFESRGVGYAIWGHVSDGNLHPNAVPQRRDDMERGREALMEAADAVIRMGGSPLAEHGVGRSAMKQRLLRQLYGDAGVDSMRAVKFALDRAGKLSPGVLFEI
jgi:D-lactate dehydrogenase (cytochrome)